MDSTEPPGSLTPSSSSSPEQFKRRAWLTLLACAACIAIFIGIHTENAPVETILKKWGWRSGYDVYRGSYWALFTAVWVHVDLWHLVFNLYWLYHLGWRLEQVIGSVRWLVFVAASAFISSSVELAVGGGTGIGASGVGYSLFGFMWILRPVVPSFAEILDQRTVIIFLVWLFACIGLTAAGILAVANGAHFGGLLFGTALAAWFRDRPRRPLIAIGIAALVIPAIICLFWAPWSGSWTAAQAVRAHTRGNFEAAIRWYERSEKLGEDKQWCEDNITLARQGLLLEKLKKIPPRP